MRFEIIPVSRPSGARILTTEQMKQADRLAIEKGVSGRALMENAGRHLAWQVHTRYPDRRRALVICGGGNNGGDGFVAARHLHGWGWRVEIILVGLSDGPSGDAGDNLAACRGIDMTEYSDGDFSASLPSEKFVVIDALLGTGVRGAPRAPQARAIEIMNHVDSPVVSADVPSGLCADRGRPLGEAVRAEMTVTFECSKWGHWLYPGPDYVGELAVVDIGMPVDVLPTLCSSGQLLAKNTLRGLSSARVSDTHKGTYGHVGVVGGSRGRHGAVLMAADAAMVAGSGLATIMTRSPLVRELSGAAYEVMVRYDLEDTDDLELMASRLDGFDALVLGPGLGTDDALEGLWDAVERVRKPLVVDADGLNLLASSQRRFTDAGAMVFTPHPGEAGRLLGIETSEVQGDRLGALRKLVERLSGVVVLKGAHTLIGDPSGRVWMCPYGNPGMASAGMGDVLAGVIASLLGQGRSAAEAACLGVVWHAAAADLCSTRLGERAIRARDVISSLPEVLK